MPPNSVRGAVTESLLTLDAQLTSPQTFSRPGGARLPLEKGKTSISRDRG